MKTFVPAQATFVLGSILCALLTGCATEGTGSTAATSQSAVTKPFGPPLPAGVVLRRDKDIQGVWLAPEFNFGGSPGLVIKETVFRATERPNEADMRIKARRAVRDLLVEATQNSGLFATVSAGESTTQPRQLVMENTIIEFEKGGGGARFWAGEFGAGQPVIRVRGELRDGDKLVCVYEVRRSGESPGARLAGSFMSDEEIQRNDIRDLAVDLATFMKRTNGAVK